MGVLPCGWFPTLRLMTAAGKGGHCVLWPAGMFVATQTEPMASQGPAKCQTHVTTLTCLNAGLCLVVVLVPLRPHLSLSLCLQLLPLSEIYTPSGLAPHLWISCLQRLDSSALCAAKPLRSDAFAQQLFTLSGTCYGLNHVTHAKEESQSIVTSSEHYLL